MREILFRGKTENGEFVEGVFIPDCLESLKGLQVRWGWVKRHWLTGEHENVQCETVEVIRETVGQFTGLTDKNGKKIFEGDIVKGYWGTFFVVYYDKDYLQYRAKLSNGSNREIDYYGDGTELEVIGNIHDNPELLEELQNG